MKLERKKGSFERGENGKGKERGKREDEEG
jgi:hypothetical protein